jgi:hypothetical protein
MLHHSLLEYKTSYKDDDSVFWAKVLYIYSSCLFTWNNLQRVLRTFVLCWCYDLCTQLAEHWASIPKDELVVHYVYFPSYISLYLLSLRGCSYGARLVRLTNNVDDSF